MRRLLGVLVIGSLLTLATPAASGADPLAMEWGKRLALPVTHEFIGAVAAHDGETYVAADVYDPRILDDRGENHDLVELRKYDAAGRLAWSRRYAIDPGTPEPFLSDRPEAVAAGPWGVVVLISHFFSGSGVAEGYTLRSYDRAGNLGWSVHRSHVQGAGLVVVGDTVVVVGNNGEFYSKFLVERRSLAGGGLQTSRSWSFGSATIDHLGSVAQVDGDLVAVGSSFDEELNTKQLVVVRLDPVSLTTRWRRLLDTPGRDTFG